MPIDGKIWNRYANWETVSSSEDEAFVKQRITGRKPGWWEENHAPAGFEKALEELKLDLSQRGRGGGTVLDFGCGLGRNVAFLRSQFSRVLGLDLPRMIEMLRKDPTGDHYDALYDDRAQLTSREDVDVVYESVVFQHIVDLDYNIDIVRDLGAMRNLRYMISLSITRLGWPQALTLMKNAGWVEVFAVEDRATFDVSHTLRILKLAS